MAHLSAEFIPNLRFPLLSMNKLLKLTAALALTGLCCPAYAQTTPAPMQTGSMADGKMMDGKMKEGKKHHKMKEGKMHGGMHKEKMSGEKMQSKM